MLIFEILQSVPRSSAEQFTLNSFEIPKDAILLQNTWSVHHDPDYWERPMEFHPGHFLDAAGRCVDSKNIGSA